MPEPTAIMLFGTGTAGLAVRFMRSNYHSARPYVDRAMALLMMILAAPVMGACALLVRLTSPGPAFYRQERVGLNGRVFWLIKLRTMRQDAESLTGPVWVAGEADPRVTAVGRLLRRTHLDELPQLINVVRGEMSLVGPRPERPQFVAEFKKVIPDYERRLSVRPGITGLAQIRAGYDQTVRDVRLKVMFDCLYIRHMCWWVDFLILASTIPHFFGKKGRVLVQSSR